MALAGRHFYRCRDCLSVFVLEGARLDPAPACGGCGATYAAWMGRVDAGRLVDDGMRSACDGRCTNAKGPACDCSCCGENHGSQRVVAVRRDVGPVPVAVVVASPEAQRRALEWRAKLALVDRELARFHQGREKTGAHWQLYYWTKARRDQATEAKSDKRRHALLDAVLAQFSKLTTKGA